MDKNVVISIDPGKYATKAIAGGMENGKRVSFRTKTFKLGDGVDLDIQGNSFKVNFEGETYVVGDQGEEIDYSVDKANLNHKLATYTAITQLIGNEKEVNLVLGCPTSIYKNEKLRKEYKKYLTNDGEIVDIDINGENYLFRINNALVLPEGYGIVFLEPEVFKNNRVAVGDLGGLNLNFGVYNDLIPEISSMFTTNLGSYELETSLINELNTRYGASFGSSDIQQFIKQGGVKVKGVIDEESKKIIDTKLEQHMVKIIQEAKKNNFNLDLMDVVFVGGTSAFLEKKIKEHLPHAIVPKNAQWANVVGFHKFGVLKYEKSRA